MPGVEAVFDATERGIRQHPFPACHRRTRGSHLLTVLNEGGSGRAGAAAAQLTWPGPIRSGRVAAQTGQFARLWAKSLAPPFG